MNNKTLSRRQFVKGVTMGATALAINPSILFAGMRNNITTLTGNTFNLNISEQSVNFTGVMRTATTVNNTLPAPLLRFKEGEMITLHVKNNLKETTSIHWHGLILPSEMDGVPDISNDFYGIKPGETFTYRFEAKQSGTYWYWYHSHSGFQEQTRLYGPILIDPTEKDPVSYDRDYVVMLSDWSDENPADIYAKLKKLSHYYNFNERTHIDLMNDIENKGLENTWNDRKMWNQMRMSQRDLSDVTGYTYTYLVNGVTPDKGWIGIFNKGEKIRLRFINGSAMTFFDVRIPGLKMTVVSADGQNIESISIDEFRIGVAETYDVVVEPKDDRAYTIFAQDIARSGYARGTLTLDTSMLGEVPELDRAPNLTHSDMDMDMSNMTGMDHDSMKMNDKSAMAGMNHSEMNHSKMDTGKKPVMTSMPHGEININDGQNMSTMDSMVTHADTDLDHM